MAFTMTRPATWANGRCASSSILSFWLLSSSFGPGCWRLLHLTLCSSLAGPWFPTLYQGEVPAKDTRPTSELLLSAGVLPGLWETDPEADVRDLGIYLSDQSLVTSLRSPTASFSNEVVECHFQAVRLHLTPPRRLCYAATPQDLPARSLSRPYAISGLSLK